MPREARGGEGHEEGIRALFLSVRGVDDRERRDGDERGRAGPAGPSGSPGQAQDPSDPIVQPPPGQDDTTIYVTARRRSELLQDVPAAITAFTDDTIEAAGIERPADFINLTSNVTLVETQNAGNAFIVIRGITQARNSEPSVAVIVDGVQQVNPAQFNQELFDIEQIEVLKGPQGGLYGRNAIGGAIVIRTRQPTDEFEGMVRAGVDNGFGYWLRGTLSGPISDTLALPRGRFLVRHRGLHQQSVPRRGGRSGRGSRPARDPAVDAERQFHGRPARLDRPAAAPRRSTSTSSPT